MRHSESIASLAAALVKAQAEIENAHKNAQNPHFRSNYADLAEIINTVRPVFSRHGLAWTQLPGMDDGLVTVETMLMHESGEWLAGTSSAPIAKADPQGVGSACTYLRRYSLAALAGIAQEDDDGNAASGAQSTGAAKAQGPPDVKAPPKKNVNGTVPATDKQTAFITKLSGSSALTEEERDGVRGRLARGMSIGQAAEAIEWMQKTIKEREGEAVTA